MALGIAAIGALAFVSGAIRRTETGPPAPIVPRVGGAYVPALAVAPPLRIDVTDLRRYVPTGATAELSMPGSRVVLKGTGGKGIEERLRQGLIRGEGTGTFRFVVRRADGSEGIGEAPLWRR